MKKKNTQSLHEVIDQYLDALDIHGKLKEVRLVRSWKDVVGTLIARKTGNIYIKDGKLFVYLDSSIARHELSMIKDSLIDRLNQEAGGQGITDIVLK